MDRIISLLAALVGLIALAGAVLVEVHGQTERHAIAAEIAALRTELAQLGTQPPPASAPVTQTDPGYADALLALQSRIVTLEQTAKSGGLTTEVASTAAPTEPSVPTGAGSTAADGPTEDCIPLGTRFMGETGQAYPMCLSTTVIKVAEVTDGTAIIEGAGPIVAGGFGKLGFNGCTIMVFSALSGFAEMRVTCE
jgi:hypothetical protein